jgi:NadR type nicotinamide-nucleotide adenylyltransferase
LRKIAITGPESTGKSWLAASLADHYDTVFVPEYARTYINGLNRPYEQDDLARIAMGQLSAEADAEKIASDYLFCDTDMLVMKIWSLHRYGTCHPLILKALENQTHELYLLCDIDLPWQYDPQREHPQLRQYFLNWYRKELDEYGFLYTVVSGQGEERLQHAIEAVEKLKMNPSDSLGARNEK